ncbi:MAG: fibronectin type III domain-containing protein [Acutalibacteraceae bacterium]
MKAGDIVWSITDEEGNDLGETAGTFDGLTFTTLDGVTINAIITATCAFDSSVSGTVKAIIGAMPIVQYDFEYTTDKDEAEADPDLEWIPSYNMPRYDRTIGTSSVYQAGQFYEQGYPVYCWPNAAITDQESMKATVVSKEDGAPVRFGSHSLKIDYSYETYNGSSNANNYLRVTCPDHAFEGSPTALGCWVYIPEGTANFVLYLNCANQCDDPVNGYNLAYATIGDCNWTGWKYCEFDLTNTSNYGSGPANAPFGFYQGCGVFWISYQPGGPKGDKTASTVYLDNIQLVYGANTDDVDNPIISSIKTDTTEIVDDETVLTSNVNTFRASYADVAGKYATGIDFDEVKMAIDGVDVTDKCYINEGDEEIYFYDAHLADGKHNIEISVSDKFGNTTTETRYFTIDGGEDESTRVYLTPENVAPILGSQYTLAIKSNNVGNVASADVSIKILSNLTTYWDKFTVVPSDSYELEAPATYDSATTTISFKAVKKDDAVSDGDDVIAKIVFDIPTNVPEGLSVTYRVSKGKLTFVTPNEDDKFVGSFSGKVTTECISPYSLTCDIMTVGSDGGKISVKDLSGLPAAGVNIYTTAGELIGVTDAEGSVFTDKYVGAVQEFQIYAEKDGQLSFIVKGQSYPAGGNEDGTPSYVKLNASEDPETTQNISWMSSPVTSKDSAVVLYAEKAAFEENGESAFAVFNGTSNLVSMDSSASYLTNYAVRINSALVDGLKANTEYVYKVGDGEKMSELKSFKTTKTGTATNFFVIGDTQATDTTNTDKITEQLAASGVDYSFGIQTGDAVDNGGNYTMWSNIAKVFSGDFLSEQDLIQVLGNHESYGDEDASNAAAYFNLPGTNEDGSAPLYYSVQYGNVYVAVINFAGLSSYKEAAEWLKEDAANATANWKILTMHQPAYFTNPSGTSPEVQTVISEAVDAAGIDVVFSGHDHSYARTEPLKGGEVDKDGTVYYICGSTGEKSYDIVNNADHHYAALDGEYNAIYLTVKATDTTLSIDTHDYTAYGEDILIDTYEIKKDIDCTESGTHDYEYSDGYLTCKVCGYAMPIGTYTGFATDAATGRTMYFLGGKATTGWFSLIDDCYYFDENGLAVTGTQTIDGIPGYKFDETGKQIGAVFVTDENGITRAYRGGTYLTGWYQQDGYWYYFSRANGEMRTGNTTITYRTNQKLDVVFSEDGKLLRGGFYTDDNGTIYYWGSEPVTGWQVIDGDTYYFSPVDFYMATDNTVIDGKMYAFDMYGVLKHEGEHSWHTCLNIIDANCTVDGKRIDVCDECGSLKTVVIPATGHIDLDGDGLCDVCESSVDFNSKVDNFLYSLFNRILNFYNAIMKIIRKNYEVISSIIPK